MRNSPNSGTAVGSREGTETQEQNLEKLVSSFSAEQIEALIEELKLSINKTVDHEVLGIVQESTERIAQEPFATPEHVKSAEKMTSDFQDYVEAARGESFAKIEAFVVEDDLNNNEESLDTDETLQALSEVVHPPESNQEVIFENPLDTVDNLMEDISIRIDQQIQGEKQFTHNERIKISDELLTHVLNLSHYNNKDVELKKIKDSLFKAAKDMRAGSLNENNLGVKVALNKRLLHFLSVLKANQDLIREKRDKRNETREVEKAQPDESEAKLQSEPYVPYIPFAHRDKELFYASYGRNPDGTPFESETLETVPPSPEQLSETFNSYVKKWKAFAESHDDLKNIPELINLEFDQSVFDSLHSGNRNIRATSLLSKLQFENYIYRYAGAKRLLGAHKAAIDAALNEFESGVPETAYVKKVTKPLTETKLEPAALHESIKKPIDALVTRFNELVNQFALRETNKLNQLISRETLSSMVFEITKLSNLDFASPQSFNNTDIVLKNLTDGINKLAAVPLRGVVSEDLSSLNAIGKVITKFKGEIGNVVKTLRETGLPQAEVTAGLALQLNDTLGMADKRLAQRYKSTEQYLNNR